MTQLFDLTAPPEEMSIGFDHSKLRYMYDEAGIREKLHEARKQIGTGTKILFVEGGKDLTYGASVHLDAITLAKHLGGTLVIVISGDADAILDEVVFVKTSVHLAEVDFGGVIINKVHDLEEFKAVHLMAIMDRGVPVLGILPYQPALTSFSIDYLAERLFARVIAGSGSLNRVVQNILVGALSADAMVRQPGFQAEDKLVITSGDRIDMILAALESDPAGVILTNNILPPPNIIAMATARNTPLLLVSADTHRTAKQIEELEPLLTPTSTEKISLLGQLIKAHVQIENLG